MPDFLIVGAAKCGTSSLAKYLSTHPDIYMAGMNEIVNEPSYFSNTRFGGINNLDDYISLFKPSKAGQITGEKSVSYLFDPESPKRIYKILGDNVKIIILLRNPVDTLYSLWGHNCRIGIETYSFESALKLEEVRKNDINFIDNQINHYNLFYMDWVKYSEQIKRYFELFSIDNIRIFIYEEFFYDNLYSYKELLKFLNVSERIDFIPKKYNSAGGVRSKWLREALTEKKVWKEPLKLIIPLIIRNKLKLYATKLNRTTTSLNTLDISLRNNLESMLSYDVKQLEKCLGRDLSNIWF